MGRAVNITVFLALRRSWVAGSIRRPATEPGAGYRVVSRADWIKAGIFAHKSRWQYPIEGVFTRFFGSVDGPWLVFHHAGAGENRNGIPGVLPSRIFAIQQVFVSPALSRFKNLPETVFGEGQKVVETKG